MILLWKTQMEGIVHREIRQIIMGKFGGFLRLIHGQGQIVSKITVT